MDENGTQKMPLSLQMALAHNVSAMNSFLKLDNRQQDEIIAKAQAVSTRREVQQIVDNIPGMISH